jgi:hypothetical protein
MRIERIEASSSSALSLISDVAIRNSAPVEYECSEGVKRRTRGCCRTAGS